MSTVPLSEFAEVNPSLGISLADTDEVSFVPMGAFSETTASVVAEEIRKFGHVKKGFTSFRNGDVLFAKITPCFENGKIGLASISKDVGFGSTEFHVIRAKSGKADARFLHHFLRQSSVRLSGTKRMTGSAGQRRVPKAFLELLPVPAFTLDEQRRIAAILDQAEELRAKRRAAIALLDQLPQAIFLEMFGDPVSNPLEWPTATLEKLVEPGFGNGVYVSQENIGFGNPMIDIKAIYMDSHVADLSEHRLVNPRAVNFASKNVLRGDLLLNRVSKLPSGVGKAVLVAEEPLQQTTYESNMIRLRPQSQMVDGFFLVYCLGMPAMRQRLISYSNIANQASINRSAIQALRLPVPPITIQHQFAERVEATHNVKAIHLSALTNLNALFTSLQAQVLSIKIDGGKRLNYV